MVWCETLRKYPLASTWVLFVIINFTKTLNIQIEVYCILNSLFFSSVVARQCMESCNINGINIQKGMLVQANVWSVHYNQEHWIEDTQKFIPER